MKSLTPLPADLAVSRYNDTLLHPTVSAAIHCFAQNSPGFDFSEFIGRIGRLDAFPVIAVGDLLQAASAAGVPLRGVHAEYSELESIPTPFLSYLRCGKAQNAPLELVQVERVTPRKIVLWRDRFGESSIARAELCWRWTGLILLIDLNVFAGEPNELESYRDKVSLIKDFLSEDERRYLIDYCEKEGFRRSRVLQRRNEVVSDVVEGRFRSSSSAILGDRALPVLAGIYARCAQLEGVQESDIETIQCVRYKPGQKFKSHYDGGTDLPRMTTYLLYLNDDFVGGETFFPILNHIVAPVAGTCLRFPSCDREGRILWPSEHGGLAVREGVKYALNVWVRPPVMRWRPVWSSFDKQRNREVARLPGADRVR